MHLKYFLSLLSHNTLALFLLKHTYTSYIKLTIIAQILVTNVSILILACKACLVSEKNRFFIYFIILFLQEECDNGNFFKNYFKLWL